MTTAFPTVHLNGTSRTELFDQNIRAMRAINDAREIVERAAPNKRDFYVQENGDQNFRDAREAHVALTVALVEAAKHFEAICLNIQEQGGR